MISRVLCAGLVAAAACATPVEPAKAWGGGVVAFGAALGVTTGVLLSRPYAYAYPYAYYQAPAYPAYAVPPTPVPYGYGYAYPPGYVVAPSAAPAPYAPAPYAPAPYAAAQAQRAPIADPSVPTCGPGRFFNRLTGTCDR